MLKTELERATSRAAAAEKEAERIHKTHEGYKKSKGKEVQDYKKRIAAAPSAIEFEAMKDTVKRVKSNASDQDYATMQNGLIQPRHAYIKLLDKCIDALDASIDDFNAKQSQPRASANAQFEFLENNGSWVAIADSVVCSALASLMRSGATVTYSFAGNNYEATLAKKGKKKASADDHDIDQKNLSTNVVRKIRDSSHVSDSASVKKKRLAEILYGSKSFLPLDATFCDNILSTFRFDQDQSYEISLQLAQLAEKFAALGSEWKYTVPIGTVPLDADACKFTSNTDGNVEVNSELFIKPIALFNWLTVARDRGYTAARLVMTGSDKAGYAGVRDDPIGFNLMHAGKHGQVYGNGLYFGLSDHATVGYNHGSGLPPGKASAFQRVPSLVSMGEACG